MPTAYTVGKGNRSVIKSLLFFSMSFLRIIKIICCYNEIFFS